MPQGRRPGAPAGQPPRGPCLRKGSRRQTEDAVFPCGGSAPAGVRPPKGVALLRRQRGETLGMAFPQPKTGKDQRRDAFREGGFLRPGLADLPAPAVEPFLANSTERADFPWEKQVQGPCGNTGGTGDVGQGGPRKPLLAEDPFEPGRGSRPAGRATPVVCASPFPSRGCAAILQWRFITEPGCGAYSLKRLLCQGLPFIRTGGRRWDSAGRPCRPDTSRKRSPRARKSRRRRGWPTKTRPWTSRPGS